MAITFGKKRSPVLLGLLIACLLSSCDGNKHASANSVPMNNIDRMSQDYEVQQLNVPDELISNDDFVLQQGVFYDHVAYFQTLDRKQGNLFPTIALYLYHTDTQKLEKIKSYDSNNTIRVMDFRLIGSDLYEIQIKQDLDLIECAIVVNGTILQINHLSSPLQAPCFTNMNGKLQYLIADINNNKRVLHFYEIDKGLISELYNEEINLIMGRRNPGKKLDVGMVNQNANPLLSFAVNRDEKEILKIYDGEKLSDVVLDKRIFMTIPLKDGVILITYHIDELDQDLQYFWYDHNNKSITEIPGEFDNISQSTQITDNSFMYNNDNRETVVGHMEDGVMSSRILDKIPKGHCFYGNLSNNQDFVELNIVHNDVDKFWEEVLFYLITWK